MHVTGTLGLRWTTLGTLPRVNSLLLPDVRAGPAGYRQPGEGATPIRTQGATLRLPRFVKQKITRKYETVKIVLTVLFAGLLLFVSAGLRAR